MATGARRRMAGIKITDIFTWLQCFGAYSLGEHPISTLPDPGADGLIAHVS